MKVNDIFYSLQGEGFNVGTPAVFIRLSGCNLCCPFCDTEFHSGTMMSEEEIVKTAAKYDSRLVVVTGGEPSLQLTETLIDALHKTGKTVAVETNGTRPLPPNVDWITLSPKEMFLGKEAKVCLREVDEVKVVYDGCHIPQLPDGVTVRHGQFLQPCDTGNAVRNTEIIKKTTAYILEHPEWRLSLQTHKILNIK